MSINKLTFLEKTSGDTLAALEWNTLTNYVNTVVDEVNSNSNDNSSNDPNNDPSNSTEGLLEQTLNPTADIEKNILYITFHSYFSFNLTYTPAGNLQNPVTLELINAFKSDNNILVSSFDISYLNMSEIQNIMNERLVITALDITDLANSIHYERLPGQISLLNLPWELSTLPDGKFFLLIFSDGILLGYHVSGDVNINYPGFNNIKLSNMAKVTESLLLYVSDLIEIVSLMRNQTGPWSV